jgi:hypothetical protein
VQCGCGQPSRGSRRGLRAFLSTREGALRHGGVVHLRPMESAMSRKSISTSAGEPSFFYLMMADGCFRRAASMVHPEIGGTLRTIGRDYLVKATKVTSELGSERSTRHRIIKYG